MESSSVIILISLFIIFITILTSRNKINKKIDELHAKINDLKDITNNKLGIVVNNQFELADIVQNKPVAEPEPEMAVEKEIKEELTKTEEAFIEENTVEYEKEMPLIVEQEFKETIKEEPIEIPEEQIPSESRIQEEPPAKEQKTSFSERFPDIEKFIGENLLSKIGIAILVIGLGFFMKFAIDKNWIGEVGRVAIGVVCGGVLIGVAHWLRKQFIAFSSVLVGGGIAVLYFTIAFAFHQFSLFNQTVAFIIMVLITAFAVLLSITYNRPELAVLAILGGFATPLMVSKGGGNYMILFTYIMILDVGMLILAYFKKWNIINIISYICTILLYAVWMHREWENVPNFPYKGGFVFVSLFYLVFFFMNIINNLRKNERFTPSEISILISNSFLYYAAGMIILDNFRPELQGIYTLSIAIFNCIFALILFRKEGLDKNLIYLLIGIVLTFLSLVAPVQLVGNHITLFWATEAVLLLWFSQKSGIKLIKVTSVIVNIAMIVSLALDWHNLYFPDIYTTEILPIVLNKAFLTSAFTILSLFLTFWFIRQEKETFLLKSFNVNLYKQLLSISTIIIIYLSIFFELSYQLTESLTHIPSINIYIGIYNFLFLDIILLWSKKQNISYFFEILIVAGIAAIFSYFLYYIKQFAETRDAVFTFNEVTLTPFVAHYLTIVLIIWLLFNCSAGISQLFGKNSNSVKLFRWFIVFVIVFICSSELDNIIILSYLGDTEFIGTGIPEEIFYDLPGLKEVALERSHLIGFPILWGFCSFVLMIIGMRKSLKEFRVISLTLFLLTLLKLFIFDVWEMSEAGKIAAFILLGVFLLIVAFLYQKLKKIIIDENVVLEQELKEQSVD